MSSRGRQLWMPGALAIALCALAAAAIDHQAFKETPLSDCASCHRTSGVTENHGPRFGQEHRLLAQKVGNNCGACHQQSYCDDCHRGGSVGDIQKGLSRRGEPMPHPSTYVSFHAIDARSDPRSCKRCHESQNFCSDCHEKEIQQNRQGMDIRPHAPTFIAPGVPDPNWVSFHSADAKRNLQTCQGCHPQKTDCSNFQCHPGLGGR